MPRVHLGLKALPALPALLALLGLPKSSFAKPQWNTGVETALCGTGTSLHISRAAFCSALHADALFLGERSSDLQLGPSLRLGTAAFADVRLDLGLSVLIPIVGEFPLVLEAGPHFRNFAELGGFGSAFFGLRTFNHYGLYAMGAGLVVTAEQSLARDERSAVWLGLRIDGSWLALPFILGYQVAAN